jgi:pimeloyl-ACP methyl ester carboxylesterase
MTRTRRRLLAYVGLAAVYVVAMFPLGCGSFLADKVLLHPSRHPMSTFGATPRYLPTPIGNMEIYVARSSSAIGTTPERFVLRLMGNASRAEREATEIALRWNDEPTEVWALNYPGFGGSDGKAKLDHLVPAATAVWQAMHDEAGGRPCFIDGDSMGTAVALSLAAMQRAERPVSGLILKNPPPLKPLILGRFGWWNLWLLAGPVAAGVPDELDSIRNAKQVHAPAIFLRATADEIIPPDYQDRVRQAYAGRVVLIELDGANHNTVLTMEESQTIQRSIAEHLVRQDLGVPHE